MAMTTYYLHMIKLEGIHRSVVQSCVDQIRHTINYLGVLNIIFIIWEKLLNNGDEDVDIIDGTKVQSQKVKVNFD
jgi:hypothetical protein